jgi:lysosomal alpha-mannosidase
MVTWVRIDNQLGFEGGIEVETFVDSIDVSSGGKEITLNVATSQIDNQNTFYTDSNGLEMVKRVLNYRPTWTLNNTDPVTGNYYPINSAIYIEDAKTRLRMT